MQNRGCAKERSVDDLLASFVPGPTRQQCSSFRGRGEVTDTVRARARKDEKRNRNDGSDTFKKTNQGHELLARQYGAFLYSWVPSSRAVKPRQKKKKGRSLLQDSYIPCEMQTGVFMHSKLYVKCHCRYANEYFPT